MFTGDQNKRIKHLRNKISEYSNKKPSFSIVSPEYIPGLLYENPGLGEKNTSKVLPANYCENHDSALVKKRN